jgi:hypothetical protein
MTTINIKEAAILAHLSKCTHIWKSKHVRTLLGRLGPESRKLADGFIIAKKK